MQHTPPGRVSWTAIAGLLLLWAAFLAVAYFAAILTVWISATAASAPTEIAVTAAPVLLLGAVLVCASLRQRWARWAAVGLGIGAGALGLTVLLITLSPSPTTVAMSLAAIVGGVLLALPASRAWFRSGRRAAPRRAEPIGGH